MATKKLRFFNGRGDYGYNGLDGKLYVAAHSKAEAVRLLKQAGHVRMNMYEFDLYWSKGTWDVRTDGWKTVIMEGIAPETGVWFVPEGHEYEKGYTPKRLL